MGPVWEANHVWLVFVLIGLFSGFPAAFGSLCRLLAVPLALALLGIVLRGAAFVFRQYGDAGPGPAVPGTLAWGRVFAMASALHPGGARAGARAAGPWTGRGDCSPRYCGLLLLAFCAYLAAVFLCREAGDDAALVMALRRRALGAAVVAGGLAIGGVGVLAADAPGLATALVDRSPWLLVASAVAGSASVAALVRSRFVAARLAAALAVASVVAGAIIARYPVVAPGLTVEDAAAPATTLGLTLAVLMVGFAVTVPSLVFLLRTFDRARA